MRRLYSVDPPKEPLAGRVKRCPRQLLCPIPVASLKKVIEHCDRLLDSNRCDFTYDFGILNRTIWPAFHPVNELAGYCRPPLLVRACAAESAAVSARRCRGDLSSVLPGFGCCWRNPNIDVLRRKRTLVAGRAAAVGRNAWSSQLQNYHPPGPITADQIAETQQKGW